MHFITNQYKQARQDVIDTIRLIPKAKEIEPVSDELSARDVLSLIIGWDQHIIQVMEAVMEGEQIQPVTEKEQYDKTAILENQPFSWTELMERFEDTSAHLLQSLEFMDEGMWQTQPYFDDPRILQDIVLDIIQRYKLYFAQMSKLV